MINKRVDPREIPSDRSVTCEQNVGVDLTQTTAQRKAIKEWQVAMLPPVPALMINTIPTGGCGVTGRRLPRLHCEELWS